MRRFYIPALTLVTFFMSCEKEKEVIKEVEVTKEATTENVTSSYANYVYNSYAKSLEDAKDMQAKINAFVNSPTENGFNTAKDAWLNARESYGLTEAFRETNSPVDAEEGDWAIGNEGQMNAWPIDESYIDYVADGTSSYAGSNEGVIQGSQEITTNLLTGLNEAGGDKNISTGWHAIEFLLWGQDNTDPSEEKTGQRPYMDYVPLDNIEAASSSDPRNHAVRRQTYLKVVTQVLVDDLQSLVVTWAPNGTYRAYFEANDSNDNLKNILHGQWFIAGDELASERMIAPVDSTDGINNTGQEDEHSCFADNTHRDIYANAKGVYNVIFGNYGAGNENYSFYDLVLAKDAAAAKKLLDAGNEAMAKVDVIAFNSKPFDYLITLESTDGNKGIVLEAVEALEEFSNQISASASVLNINIVE